MRGSGEARRAGRPTARLAPCAGCFQHGAAEEHALEIRGGDVVAERGRMEITQLSESGKDSGASANPMFV